MDAHAYLTQRAAVFDQIAQASPDPRPTLHLGSHEKAQAAVGIALVAPLVLAAAPLLATASPLVAVGGLALVAGVGGSMLGLTPRNQSLNHLVVRTLAGLAGRAVPLADGDRARLAEWERTHPEVSAAAERWRTARADRALSLGEFQALERTVAAATGQSFTPIRDELKDLLGARRKAKAAAPDAPASRRPGPKP